MTKLKAATVCSGVGAPEVALGDVLDFQWSCEFEKFPSEVLKYRFPHIPNLGNMLALHDNPIFNSTNIDALIGGTPCFPSGHYVLTRRGLIDISEVVVGDDAVTHLGEYRRVLKIGNKSATTYELKGQGSKGIRTTADHPFYSMQRGRKWDSTTRSYKPEFSEPTWTEAADMVGRYWATPINYPKLPVPEMVLRRRESVKFDITPSLMWVAGYAVGDGWTRITDRRGYLTLSCNEAKYRKLLPRLAACGITPVLCDIDGVSKGFKVQISSRPLARWFRENFGSGARDKYFPSWAFGMSIVLRQSLLDGYYSADGHDRRGASCFTTISDKLAHGVKMLGASLGYTCSVSHTVPPKSKQLLGRTVNQQPYYQTNLSNKSKSAFEHECNIWHKVKSFGGESKIETVFNLEVEGHNSYLLDGISVHNCQGFSVAGSRGGLQHDPRSRLSLEFVRILRTKQPKWFIWENVPGVFSSWSDAEDSEEEMREDEERNCDQTNDLETFLSEIQKCGYGLCWRILDARHFGVPQRRRRIFVVGYLGDWRPPYRVLFESDSLRGDTEQSGDEGEAITNSPGGDPDETSGITTKSVAENQRGEVILGDITRALAGQGGKPGQGYPCIFRYSKSTRPTHIDVRAITDDTTNTLNTGDGCSNQSTQNIVDMPELGEGGYVRKLTPLECERLQGFPDNYTQIPYKGRAAADCPKGPRYKAMGNSMAEPVMKWLGNRLVAVNAQLRLEEIEDWECL